MTTLPGVPAPNLTEPTCDSYVGIEIIYLIEITEVCPEGATGKSNNHML